jgi:serine/threonine protein kinase
VVHRHLKPSNVILAPTGPRILDFGIARDLADPPVVRGDLLLGSPAWISPEEYLGQPAGPEADVHAWGMLMLYAASGRQPFGTGDAGTVALRVIRDPVDTRAVPEMLRDLVDRALSKNPQQRPTARALREILEGRQPDGMYDVAAVDVEQVPLGAIPECTGERTGAVLYRTAPLAPPFPAQAAVWPRRKVRLPGLRWGTQQAMTGGGR